MFSVTGYNKESHTITLKNRHSKAAIGSSIQSIWLTFIKWNTTCFGEALFYIPNKLPDLLVIS